MTNPKKASKKEGDDKESSSSTTTTTTIEKKKKIESSEKETKTIPPLEAAARRLERLLGGGVTTTATTTSTSTATSSNSNGNTSSSSSPQPIVIKKKEEQLLVSNPAKIVRRWLGSSSGATSDCTLNDVSLCAMNLLDSSESSPVAFGRRLLLEAAESGAAAAVLAESVEAMTTEDDEEETKKKTEGVSSTTKDEEMKDVEEEKEGIDEASSKQHLLLVVAYREVEAWLLSLAVRCLWKLNLHKEAYELSNQGIRIVQSFLDSVTSNVVVTTNRNKPGAITVMNSPALFPLLARLYRWRSLTGEVALGSPTKSAEMLRSDLVYSHRMACLRRDVDCQATLLNLMLRDLLLCHQVEQAQKLLTNSTFPDQGSVSNNQLCRFLYHSGHIQALRLEYTLAYSNLSQCLRKAPTNTALGFRIAAQRLQVIVQLLMGEIPDRNLFFVTGMRMELEPYLKITQAVRRGDLRVFQDTVSEYASRLRDDGTYTLISRLSHSVVKAGLRKLNVSYSRISLQDVADRLSLPSASSAEFVVAKAVRDGVIDATIDHEHKFVKSHDLVDVYATTEPMEAFHRRIAYCLTTHNDAMRGMRYPPDAYKKQLEASRGGGKLGSGNDDDKTDEEKAQELEDEMDDEF